MDIKNSIRKDRKQRDSITKQTKMIIIKSTNSTIAKRRKGIIKNMVAITNSMIRRKELTRKAKNMILALMKATKVFNISLHMFNCLAQSLVIADFNFITFILIEGKKGHNKKGHYDDEHKGYKGKHGHEKSHSHHDEYGKKGGKKGGHEKGYESKGH